ncbi:MAG: hypothetical protein M1834_008211 [Cirrosporium novae-zelandiae]|nr:MAG: hypothetical protein M1834_008211 [Cirrosporium novae-zelandiae]
MSSNSLPITAARFAEAITTLPLGNLHLKAAELRNSIAHLESSNVQLKPHADDGDQDCQEAIEENMDVISRMEDRIRLLKEEVERRGFRWGEGQSKEEKIVVDGVDGDEDSAASSGQIESHAAVQASGGGHLTDEELERRLQERMQDDIEDDEEEDGVHL